MIFFAIYVLIGTVILSGISQRYPEGFRDALRSIPDLPQFSETTRRVILCVALFLVILAWPTYLFRAL